MKELLVLMAMTISTICIGCDDGPELESGDFSITAVRVVHDKELEVLIWEIQVSGMAGASTPNPVGQLHGAPVFGYVFPTGLSPTDVGFGDVDGIVALAITSHPDFDDTPLWDENNDQDYANDGVVWHSHWVVLVQDDRVEGALSVKQFDTMDTNVILPPTNPGMPMYMDSPGFAVSADGNLIRAVVPTYRVNRQVNFNYDGVAAYMEVNVNDDSRPMLGVYEVYSVASGNLSLPYQIQER